MAGVIEVLNSSFYIISHRILFQKWVNVPIIATTGRSSNALTRSWSVCRNRESSNFWGLKNMNTRVGVFIRRFGNEDIIGCWIVPSLMQQPQYSEGTANITTTKTTIVIATARRKTIIRYVNEPNTKMNWIFLKTYPNYFPFGLTLASFHPSLFFSSYFPFFFLIRRIYHRGRTKR